MVYNASIELSADEYKVRDFVEESQVVASSELTHRSEIYENYVNFCSNQNTKPVLVFQIITI